MGGPVGRIGAIWPCCTHFRRTFTWRTPPPASTSPAIAHWHGFAFHGRGPALRGGVSWAEGYCRLADPRSALTTRPPRAKLTPSALARLWLLERGEGPR